MQAPRDWPNLHFDFDGLPLIRPCLHFEADVAWAEGPEVLDFYTKGRAALGTLLTHTDATSRRLAPITPRSEALVPTWFANPVPAIKKIYGLFMQGCAKGTSEASLSIDFAMRPYETPTPSQIELAWRNPASSPWLRNSSVRISIPIDHTLAEPGLFVEWICGLKIFNEAYTASASAGFAINPETMNPPHQAFSAVRDRASALLLRYPGLDAANIRLGVGNRLFQRCFEYMEFMGGPYGRPYVKRVNWLTWLTEDQVRFIGGFDSLRKQLAVMPSIKLHVLGRGVLIQAGPEPRLGDVAEDDYPAEYCVVADAIRAVRLVTLRGGDFNEEFSLDSCHRWLSMFEGRNPRVPTLAG